ncbi:hypothetical protein HQ533_00925 [Candidatus Woesearchaeota archaeon]|nr:hypothetical protein [Candidatus Woesearchaeota archaeon]
MFVILATIPGVLSVQDNNLTNNNMLKYVNVTATRTLRITYVPVDTLVSNYETNIEDNQVFMQATYPIRDKGINNTVLTEIHNSGSPDFSKYPGACGFLENFSKAYILSENKYVRVVGITYDSWFAERNMKSITRGYTCFDEIPAAIISADWRQNAAHELGHTYGLCDEYENSSWTEQNKQYVCPNGDEDDNDVLDSNCLGSPDGCPIKTDRKVVPHRSGEGNITLYNFMGGSTYEDKRWITRTSYAYLLSEFTNDSYTEMDTDEAMMISGTISVNDTVEIDPIYWLENSTLYNGTFTGNYSISVKEGASEYHSKNFTADFFLYTIGGNSTLLNESRFVFVLPASDNITSVVISKNGIPLKEINVSPNAPSIVINPIIEAEPIENTFNLTWNSSDADNDTLYYAILVSSNNGANYTTLEIDYNTAYYEINPANFDYSEEYLFKIMVSDGSNSNYNFSNVVALGIRVRNISISSVQTMYSNSTYKIFEIIGSNTGDITLNNINWSIDFGDGTEITSTDNFSLSPSESITIIAAHNYSSMGDFNFVINVTSGNTSDESSTIVNIGDLFVSSLSLIYSNSFIKIFETIILNDGYSTLTNVNWSFYTGESTIYADNLINILHKSNISFIFAVNYSNYGFYDVISSTFDEDLFSNQTLHVDIDQFVVTNLSQLDSSGSDRLFEFIVTGYESDLSLPWKLDTGEVNITSTQNITLNSSEFAFIIVGYNYTGNGSFQVNASVNNSEDSDNDLIGITV